MPKPQKPQRPKETAVKMESELARKAKAVAAIRGVSLAEYLDSVNRPAIERDYAKLSKES